MSLSIIPLRSDIPNYEQRVELQGTQFILAFRYNERKNRWIMDVKTSNDQPLVMGLPLLLGIQLLEKYVMDGLPQGNLFLANIENLTQEAGANDLGENVILFYEDVQ